MNKSMKRYWEKSMLMTKEMSWRRFVTFERRYSQMTAILST
nr:hypothetical protein [Agathobacter rectalis]